MRKFLILTLFLSFTSLAWAASLSVKTSFAPPQDGYDKLRLYPIPEITGGCGEEGLLYYNVDDHELMICRGGSYGSVSGYWQTNPSNEIIMSPNNAALSLHDAFSEHTLEVAYPDAGGLGAIHIEKAGDYAGITFGDDTSADSAIFFEGTDPTGVDTRIHFMAPGMNQGLTITEDGLLGFGTSTPDLNSNITLYKNTSNEAILTLENNSNEQLKFSLNDTNKLARIYNPDYDPFGNHEAIQITPYSVLGLNNNKIHNQKLYINHPIGAVLSGADPHYIGGDISVHDAIRANLDGNWNRIRVQAKPLKFKSSGSSIKGVKLTNIVGGLKHAGVLAVKNESSSNYETLYFGISDPPNNLMTMNARGVGMNRADPGRGFNLYPSIDAPTDSYILDVNGDLRFNGGFGGETGTIPTVESGRTTLCKASGSGARCNDISKNICNDPFNPTNMPCCSSTQPFSCFVPFNNTYFDPPACSVTLHANQESSIRITNTFLDIHNAHNNVGRPFDADYICFSQ